MRIAISADSNDGLNSTVAHHFGRCPYFVLADVEDGEVKNVNVIDNPYYSAHQPGQVPGFIKEQGVDVMLSGGMGRRAIQFFEQYGIESATGATGTAGSALECYLSGDMASAAPCKESEEHHQHGHHH